MPLVTIERDCTGQEASEFVADLAAEFIKSIDFSGVLDDVQATAELGSDDLRDILLDHMVSDLTEDDDEELLGWIIAYLVTQKCEECGEDKRSAMRRPDLGRVLCSDCHYVALRKNSPTGLVRRPASLVRGIKCSI